MDDKIMARMALAQVQVEKVNLDIKINKPSDHRNGWMSIFEA